VKECRNRTRSLGEVFRRVNPKAFGALALLVVRTENLDPDVVVIEVVGLGQYGRTLTVLTWQVSSRGLDIIVKSRLCCADVDFLDKAHAAVQGTHEKLE
jgi:hypothetical protein